MSFILTVDDKEFEINEENLNNLGFIASLNRLPTAAKKELQEKIDQWIKIGESRKQNDGETK